MLRAPYNNAMRLGQGFNSFTQQLCMTGAVGRKERKTADDPDADAEGDEGATQGMSTSQIVSYSSKFVDKVSDVTSAMNISAALSIKGASFSGSLSGKYVDTDKFKESDLNFFIQVSVTNQEHSAYQYSQFRPLPHLPPGRFTEIYGDSFISGWEEGGEFNALLSIKLKDKATATNMQGAIEAELGKGPLTGKVEGKGELDKAVSDHAAETTITVNWSGGGQLKEIDQIWDIKSLTLAAANFPELVAMTPQRKYAILTKYTALRSFMEYSTKFSPLDYENAGIYASSLLENYTDYKAIWKSLQVLTEDVQAGLRGAELVMNRPAPEITKALQDFHSAALDTAKKDLQRWTEREDNQTIQKLKKNTKDLIAFLTSSQADQESAVAVKRDSEEDLEVVESSKKPFKPYIADYNPYPATVVGLLQARHDCRMEMVKIVNEVDVVTADPGIALDPERSQTFVSPALFKELIPLKKPIRLYDEDPVLLPDEVKASIKKHTDDAANYRMSASWSVNGEPGRDKDIYFNDLEALDEEDRVSTIYVYHNDQVILGLRTIYNTGRVISHYCTKAREYAYLKELNLDKDQQNPVKQLMLQGHQYGPRSSVDAFYIDTGRVSLDVQPKSRSTTTVRRLVLYPPNGMWDIRGFWGHLSHEIGFTRLGVVWGRIQSAPVKLPPPLLQDTTCSGMTAALKAHVAEYSDLGQYYRLGPCAGDPKASADKVICFSLCLQNAKPRGLKATRINFVREKAGHWLRMFTVRYEDHITYKCPAGSVEDDNTFYDSFTDGEQPFDVQEVTIKTKKLSDATKAPCVCYVKLVKGSGQVTEVETDPGTEAAATSVSKRPPNDGRDWRLAGFYGTAGDDIQSLGVVWARDT